VGPNPNAKSIPGSKPIVPSSFNAAKPGAEKQSAGKPVGAKNADTPGFKPGDAQGGPGKGSAGGGPAAKGELNYPKFSQGDPKWAGNKLGDSNSRTLRQAGCALTSVASMLAARGVDTNPAKLNQFMQKEKAFMGAAIAPGMQGWGAVDKLGATKFGGVKSGWNQGQISQSMKDGNTLIANVRGGHHWVVLSKDMGSGNYKVMDPGFPKQVYTAKEISRVAVYGPAP